MPSGPGASPCCQSDASPPTSGPSWHRETRAEPGGSPLQSGIQGVLQGSRIRRCNGRGFVKLAGVPRLELPIALPTERRACGLESVTQLADLPRHLRLLLAFGADLIGLGVALATDRALGPALRTDRLGHLPRSSTVGAAGQGLLVYQGELVADSQVLRWSGVSCQGFSWRLFSFSHC